MRSAAPTSSASTPVPTPVRSSSSPGIGGGYYAVAAGALVGGLVTAVLVYALSYRNGLAGYRLIVVGIGVSAVLNSVNQWIVIKLDLHIAVTAAVWQQGTLSGLELVAGAADDGVPARSWRRFWSRWDRSCRCCRWATTPPVRWACGRIAPGSAYLVVGVGLVAVACAAAGPVSFVALAAPQIARRLTASPGVGLVPSAAMGAVLLLVSDVIAQQLFSGNELPVGAVTVSLGGVYLIYLLISQARRDERIPAKEGDFDRDRPVRPRLRADHLSIGYDDRSRSSPTCRVDVLDGRITAIVGPERMRQVHAAARTSPDYSNRLADRSSWTGTTSATCTPRRWPAGWGCCPRPRSHRRASRWPTWCPGAGSRIRRCCGSGRAATTAARSPRRCGAPG